MKGYVARRRQKLEAQLKMGLEERIKEVPARCLTGQVEEVFYREYNGKKYLLWHWKEIRRIYIPLYISLRKNM